VKISVTCIFSSKPSMQVVLIGTESILKNNEPESSDKLLGDIKSEPFTISSGETKTITVQLPNNQLKKTPIKIHNTLTNWYWTYECEGKVEFAENSKQTIYTILDTPLAPWKYKDKGTNLPWTEVLGIAADWINKDNKTDLNEDGICKQLTSGVYTCGLKFNNDTGAPVYIQNPTLENTNLEFDMYTFKNNYKAEPKTFPEYGCSSLDCSLLLASLARLHGITMNQITLFGGKFNQGFHINQVKPIGFETWVHPYANGTDPIGFLGYQCLAVRKGALDIDAWYNYFVYDSCFKLNSVSEGEVLPVKMQLANILSDQTVGINDAGTYRGQLVLPEENNYVAMPVTSKWKLNTEKPKEPDKKIFRRLRGKI
jgi:hypothetical protein